MAVACYQLFTVTHGIKYAERQPLMVGGGKIGDGGAAADFSEVVFKTQYRAAVEIADAFITECAARASVFAVNVEIQRQFQTACLRDKRLHIGFTRRVVTAEKIQSAVCLPFRIG